MDEMPERMTACFAQVIGDPGLIPVNSRKPDPSGYARYVLHADPLGRFTIVALVWDAGQFSPIHGHHTWCAYGVHEGEMAETGFAYDPAAKLAVSTGTVTKSGGSASFAFAGLGDVHKLGNGCDNVARSIHIYGLDAARIGSHVNRVVRAVPPA
jgi:predicted metal-dependent enzyme (double-stranded beta helix superfamily)